MKLLAGEPHAECLTFARQQWGVSRPPSYRLLAWSIQTLIAGARQAKEQGNPGAVVACVRQLDWLVGMGLNSAAGHAWSPQPALGDLTAMDPGLAKGGWSASHKSTSG